MVSCDLAEHTAKEAQNREATLQNFLGINNVLALAFGGFFIADIHFGMRMAKTLTHV